MNETGGKKEATGGQKTEHLLETKKTFLSQFEGGEEIPMPEKLWIFGGASTTKKYVTDGKMTSSSRMSSKKRGKTRKTTVCLGSLH